MLDQQGAEHVAAQITVGEIHSRFTKRYAEIDGDYSRTVQYAGYLRQELMESAVKERDAALARVKHGEIIVTGEIVTDEEV